MDLDALFLRGKESADGGNYDYAIAIFLDVIRLQPNHLKSMRALRGCELAKFQEQGGSARLKGFLKGFPNLLTAFLPGLKPDKVAQACEKYLVHDPVNITVLCRAGKAYERMGAFEAAADTLEFARQRKPAHIGVLRRLGDVCHSMGEHEKAVRCFQEITRLRPSDRDAAQKVKRVSAEWHLKKTGMEKASSFRSVLRDEQQADTLLREDRRVHSDAEKDARVTEAQKAVEAAPTDARAWQKLGDVLFEMERFAEAEKAYLKELEISKSYNARERVGTSRLRRLRQAEHEAERAAEAGGTPDLAAKARDAKARRLDFAVKEYEFRCQQHPTDLTLAWELANYYFDRGKPEDIANAVKQFQRAMGNMALRIKAQLMLAKCFALNPKTLDMARDQLVQALESVEDPSLEVAKRITYDLGEISEKLGQKDEAAKYYKRIYAIDAGFRDVARKVQELG